MPRVSRATEGARLAAMRRERELTQAILATRSGFTVFYVSKLETGAVPITDSALVKLARGLSTDADPVNVTDLETRLGRRNGKAVQS